MIDFPSLVFFDCFTRWTVVHLVKQGTRTFFFSPFSIKSTTVYLMLYFLCDKMCLMIRTLDRSPVLLYTVESIYEGELTPVWETKHLVP